MLVQEIVTGEIVTEVWQEGADSEIGIRERETGMMLIEPIRVRPEVVTMLLPETVGLIMAAYKKGWNSALFAAMERAMS